MTLQIEASTFIAIALTIAYYAVAAVVTYQASDKGKYSGGYINIDLWGAFVGVASTLVATIAALITWMVWM